MGYSFDREGEPIYLGRINPKIIDLLALQLDDKHVVIWKDRLNYIKKHMKDFRSEEEFYVHMNEIPNIIQRPDYVGLHPSDGSIQFVKKINVYMIVGVRISATSHCAFRTAYPISSQKLQNYLSNQRIVPVVFEIDTDE